MGQPVYLPLATSPFDPLPGALSADERHIVETAHALYTRVPLIAACYHYSFFLHYYLRKRFGVMGHVEVGFIRDSQTGRSASHAWYVYRGMITDLAVSRPHDPEWNAPGPLIILGQCLTAGQAWQYHPHGTAEALAALRSLLEVPSSNPDDLASYAKQIHIKTLNAAKTMAGIRAYLDEAPPGLKYRDLVTRIEKPDQFQAGSGYRPLEYLL